jgi:hypothetical protein
MKALKMLMVFVTTFCLLNVQYQSGVVKISLTNDVQAQGAQNLKAEGVYQGEDAENADGFLDQILYLAVGLFTAGGIIKYSESSPPVDVIIAAIGGGILLLGELMMMSSNEEAVAAMELNYTMDNNGKTYKNSQLEAFRTQLKMNEELASALKTKQMIQFAGTAALSAATVVALAVTTITEITDESTIAAATTASTASFGTLAAPCGACVGSVFALKPLRMTALPSCPLFGTKLTQWTIMKTCPVCIPAAVTEPLIDDAHSCAATSVLLLKNDSWPKQMEQMYAKQNPAALKITKNFINNFELSETEKLKQKNDYILNALYNKINAKPIISFSNPLNRLPSLSSSKGLDESEINFYMRMHENKNYLKGDIKSVSLQEYNHFESVYKYNDLSLNDQGTMKNILVTAAEKGLNLIFPKAEAGYMKLLGVVGGVLVGVYVMSSKRWDTIFNSSKYRAIAWGVMSAIVAYSLTKTMDGLSQTENNIEKLKKILNNLSSLTDAQVIDLGGGPTGGGGASDLGTKPIFGNVNGEATDLGLGAGNVTPCLAGKISDGTCKSVSRVLKAASSVEGFNLGGGLAGASSILGAIGDGISGASILSGATLGNLTKLNGKKGALANNRRAALAKLDKVLKRTGQNPFGLNKKVSDFHKQMKASLKSSLAKQGLSPKLAAAKLGITGGAEAKKDGKEEGIQNREGVAAAGGAGAFKAGGKKIDFGFGSAGKVPKTAAMQFDDPNVVAKDMEEYILDDISTDKSADIFQIISVRYLKSGFNRLRSAKGQSILNN